MIKKLFFFGGVYLISVAAAPKQNSCTLGKPTTEVPCDFAPPPPAVKKTVKKTIVRTKIVKEKDPCCGQSSASSEVTEQNQSVNQSVNVNVNGNPYISERASARYRIREVPTFKTIYPPRNVFSVLLGASKTSVQTKSLDCCSTTVTKGYEFDAGLQYMHSFNSFSGSILGTLSGNLYLGVGFNF